MKTEDCDGEDLHVAIYRLAAVGFVIWAIVAFVYACFAN